MFNKLRRERQIDKLRRERQEDGPLCSTISKEADECKGCECGVYQFDGKSTEVSSNLDLWHLKLEDGTVKLI
jgi:hypothetical protein